MNKTSITASQFAMICFLTLMQNGDGLIDKHPDYIEEKINMLQSRYHAFGYLDYHNMTKVIEYLKAWHIEIPEIIESEYKLQTEANNNFPL